MEHFTNLLKRLVFKYIVHHFSIHEKIHSKTVYYDISAASW